VCHDCGRHVDKYDFVRALADDECRHVRTAFVPGTPAARRRLRNGVGAGLRRTQFGRVKMNPPEGRIFA
jgi:hypothetical protein